MLKLLEEPPPDTYIYLIAKSPNFFLPTIISRVKLIELSKKREINDEPLKKIEEHPSIGDKLYLAEQLSKDKEKAIEFLEDAILKAREEMIENADNPTKSLKLRNIIHNLEITHYDLKNTNVTPRLSLENAFFNLP